VGATYKVEAKPSDPALGFGAEAEPFANPVLTATELDHNSELVQDFHASYPGKPAPLAAR
jgi:hypothetical protein